MKVPAAALIAGLSLATAALAGSNWSIDWYGLSSGGVVEGSAGNWSLSASAGAPDATGAEALSSASWTITGGFWALVLADPPGDPIFRDRFAIESMPGVTFSDHLAVTFRHPRCVTCHAVAATDFRRVNDEPPGVLPASHPIVNAGTDCVACHTSALLPGTGKIDPGWQSAPAHLDFRNLDDATLCNMASQPVSGHGPLDHMTQDRLVLWAVGDGRVPFGNPALPLAPPQDIPTWQQLVAEWVADGMNCD